MIYFVIHGQPVGKARPRMTRSGHCYTPAKTMSYEGQVKSAFAQKAKDMAPRDDMAVVNIVAYFQAPMKIRKKLICDNDWLPCGTRPDCDNVAKAILDALNGLAWTDDSRVSELSICKRYAIRPRVTVAINWPDNEQ